LFTARYFYNSWRPVTAIQRTDVWLPSQLNVSDPTWTPLLAPTPNHQDYLSTHATFGGAGAAVIAAFNGGDKVDVLLSSNVTIDNIGVITRRITSLTAAAKENGNSRVFGGVSASLTTPNLGFTVSLLTYATDSLSICL
jgi:hypothetical protein